MGRNSSIRGCGSERDAISKKNATHRTHSSLLVTFGACAAKLAIILKHQLQSRVVVYDTCNAGGTESRAHLARGTTRVIFNGAGDSSSTAPHTITWHTYVVRTWQLVVGVARRSCSANVHNGDVSSGRPP